MNSSAASTPAQFVVLLGYMCAVGGIAIGCSSIAHDRGRAGAYAATIVLTSYMLKLVSSLSTTFDWLRYFSIFTAYLSLPALQKGTVPPETAVLYLVGAAGAGFGLVYFQRRDIVI
ncbi:MAG: hypothetical protein R3A46_12860 [Thermomicrobiales bacterium]